MDPPQTLPSMSSQFWRPIPAPPQSQQFIPVASQHFQPVGRGVPMVNVRVPPQAPQPPVYCQPMPQLPPRPGQPGMLLPTQTVPLAVGQPKGHFTPESPLPLPSSQTPNNYMPSLGGGRGMPLSSSYTFTPSYGLQRGIDGSTQYQSIPQVHVGNVSSGGQLRSSTESQSTATVRPMQQTNEQPPMMNVTAPASTQPSLSAEASSDWREHTSADGRRCIVGWPQ